MPRDAKDSVYLTAILGRAAQSGMETGTEIWAFTVALAGNWVGVILFSLAIGAGIAAALWWLRIRFLGGGNCINGYVVGDVLGRGGFGEVSRGHPIAGGEMIALKVPHNGAQRWSNEANTLKRINPPPYHQAGFAKLLFVSDGVIGMSLLGPSLESVKKALPDERFSVKTALLLADQAVDLIMHMHTKRTLHRDIKPENFLLGLRDARRTLHLVDFGLSDRFYDGTVRRHKPYREGCTVYGTPYFSSLTSDRGCEQGRRDDVESLGYSLVYLVKGTLPWIGLKGAGPMNTWHRRVAEMKERMPLAELCEGLPSEFSTIISHARGLKFSEKPDYGFIKEIISRRYAKLGFAADNQYDWSAAPFDSWPCWNKGGTPAGNPDVDRE